jgi:carboxymethylenebutenolidase
MRTSETMVSTPDGEMMIYEAAPAGEPPGAIIVIQEAFGVNAHIQDVTRRVAAAGYYAVAPDLFHRSGPGSVVEYGEFSQVLEFFKDLGDDDAILRDIDATLAHLRSEGFEAPSRLGIVGFCFGGRVTFLVALRRALGAAVGFYGGGIVTGRFPQFPALAGEVESMQTPWLGLFGDQDTSIPVEDVEQLGAALVDAPVETEVVRYAEAGHGFHCDERDSYRADDAVDAWSRAVAWFDRHLATS